MNWDCLSPAAWIVAMRDSWPNMSDVDVIHHIYDFMLRTDMSIEDVWRELGIKISRRRDYTCLKCGRPAVIWP